MTDTEKTLEYFEKHENRLKKVVHAFLWNYSRWSCDVDLYFYPDTKKFYEFVNPGGNSWLNDSHITIYSCNGECLEIEKGRFREYVNGQTEQVMYDIFDYLSKEVEREKERQEEEEVYYV